MFAFGNHGGSKPPKKLFTFPFRVPAQFFACSRFEEAINALPCARCGSTLKVEAYQIPKTRPGWSLPICAFCLPEIAGRDLKTVLLWFQRQGIDAMVVSTRLHRAWSNRVKEPVICRRQPKLNSKFRVESKDAAEKDAFAIACRLRAGRIPPFEDL
jgi:hypothetical protein